MICEYILIITLALFQPWFPIVVNELEYETPLDPGKTVKVLSLRFLTKSTLYCGPEKVNVAAAVRGSETVILLIDESSPRESIKLFRAVSISAPVAL